MLGLIIRDHVRWHDRWSSEIGRHLAVMDSTDNMYVFDEKHSREDVLSVLGDAPDDLYQLVELETAPEENCDFMLDSGQCYTKIQ